VFAITPDDVVEHRSVRAIDTPPIPTTPDSFLWVDAAGLSDIHALSELARRFHIHPLALEDVLHVHQRAKVEQFDAQVFVVARMPEWHQDLEEGIAPQATDGQSLNHDRLISDQLSIFLGNNYLLTIQERLGDCFEPLRHRLRQRHGSLRIRTPGHLLHAILDAIIDSYFPIVEHLGARLEEIEDHFMSAEKAQHDLREVHDVRVNLLQLRRMIWPFREAIGQLMRSDSPLLDSEVRLYLRDCYDHTVQLIDVIETYREICAELRELHYAQVSQQANETMRVLTVISTLFIPMTFIAGVYGMNFDPNVSPWNMPELRWWFGYPLALLLMSAVATGMITFFLRRRWI
jgi:magnesium transporter